MQRLRNWLLIVAIMIPMVGCAQFKENMKQIPLGAELIVPGLQIGASNDPEEGFDTIIDFDMGEFFIALKTLFWNIPLGFLDFFLESGDAVVDEVNEVVEEAVETETPMGEVLPNP